MTYKILRIVPVMIILPHYLYIYIGNDYLRFTKFSFLTANLNLMIEFLALF
jgi:hypothetical protein